MDIDGSLLVSANPFLLFNLRYFIYPPTVEVSAIGLLVKLAWQIPCQAQILYLRI